MTGVDLSKTAKLVVIWILLKCYYVVNLILNSVWILLVFIVNFVHLGLFFFALHIFEIFVAENRQTKHIHNNIIDISSFQSGLNNLLSSTGFYFKSNVIQGSHNGKNMIFNFWALLLRMYIFEVVTFFVSHLVVIQSTQFFSDSTY